MAELCVLFILLLHSRVSIQSIFQEIDRVIMVVIMLRLIYGPYDTQQGCCHFEQKGVAADSKRKELRIIPFHADRFTRTILAPLFLAV